MVSFSRCGRRVEIIVCYVNVNTLYWFYAGRQHKQSSQTTGRFLLLVLTSVGHRLCLLNPAPCSLFVLGKRLHLAGIAHVCMVLVSSRYPSSNTARVCLSGGHVFVAFRLARVCWNWKCIKNAVESPFCAGLCAKFWFFVLFLLERYLD